MSIRHVIDESGMRLQDLSGDEVTEVVYDFLERLDAARTRGEPVARTLNLYDAPVTDDSRLFQFLFEDERNSIDDIDLRRRLQHAIDRAYIWDEDDQLLELVLPFTDDVVVAGEPASAPSVVLAHVFRDSGRALGCLNFRSSGRAGLVGVQVGERSQELHFIVDERTHLALFRDAVDIEDMGPPAFAENAASAFPNLLWADQMWSGLNKFKRPYREHRRVLVRHLGVLNDVAGSLFDELMSTRPEEIGHRLDALGVEASDENGRTKQDRKAQKERTRRFEGEDLVFWWHTKLLPNTDRVHFLWRQAHGGLGEIVVGLFTDHCHTPS